VRLGYAGLPMFMISLSDRHFTVARRQARFVDRGGYAIYGEKSRAGLRLFDRYGNPLHAASDPERAYPDFASIRRSPSTACCLSRITICSTWRIAGATPDVE
jgi:hypothetical protein